MRMISCLYYYDIVLYTNGDISYIYINAITKIILQFLDILAWLPHSDTSIKCTALFSVLKITMHRFCYTGLVFENKSMRATYSYGSKSSCGCCSTGSLCILSKLLLNSFKITPPYFIKSNSNYMCRSLPDCSSPSKAEIWLQLQPDHWLVLGKTAGILLITN